MTEFVTKYKLMCSQRDRPMNPRDKVLKLSESNPGQSSSVASTPSCLFTEKKEARKHRGSLRGNSTRCLPVTKVTRTNQNLDSW